MAINLSLRLYLIANAIVIAVFFALSFLHRIELDVILLISLFSLLLSLPSLIFLAIFFAIAGNMRKRISDMWIIFLVVAGILGCIPGGIITLIEGMHVPDICLVFIILGIASAWFAILLQAKSIHQFFKSNQQ